MQWRVDVRAAGIAANAQLDFHPEGTHERPPTLRLSAGDGFHLVYPAGAREAGTVLETTSDTAIIEISNTRWQLRRASGDEDLIPAAEGTHPIVWLAGAKLP